MIVACGAEGRQGVAHILAIDQGTTSSRAIVFDEKMSVVAVAQEEFAQHFPRSGWVEHAPADLWETVRRTCLQAVEKAGVSGDVAGIGITNQRETTLVWDRATGEPVAPAIVWQDRRTAEVCRRLREAGHEGLIRARTGLVLDPYFSGTKLAWILDNVDGARARAEAGELAFGTVDSWLIWQLTGRQVHATDATNASRTMLYNIVEGQWDREICDLLNVPIIREPRPQFGWDAWAVPEGLDPASLPEGPVFPDAALCFDAAMAGGGVFLAFETLCRDALDRGQVEAPIPRMHPNGLSYWLVSARDRALSEPARIFRRWLRAELAASGMGVGEI